jgi:hypothetical protein
MSITATITEKISLGNKWAVIGTYEDSSAGTADDIDTGLQMVDFMILQPSGSAVDTNAPAVNETLPTDGSAVSVIVDASSTGYWFAIGWGA